MTHSGRPQQEGGRLSKAWISVGVLLAACAIWLLPPYLVQSDAVAILGGPVDGSSNVKSDAAVSPSPTVPAVAASTQPSPQPSTDDSAVLQLTPASAAALGSARQSVLLAIGGLIAVITLTLSYARHRREETASDLAADSNKTDRYSQAIDQLGSAEIPIQLGGVYALERLARDSENDRQTIVDVLAAFLRTTSPVDPGATENPTIGTVSAAAATVIGRMQPLGLALRIDLTGVNLTRARLEGSSFEGAILNGAVLDHAHLDNASLDQTQINNASFVGSFLAHATLRAAKGVNSAFTGARAHHADFSDASLRYGKITGLSLQDSILSRTDFTGARLHGTKFARARLDGTEFAKANVNLADFTGADMTKARLNNTNMKGAKGYNL